jgi:regulator of replication initiation timing
MIPTTTKEMEQHIKELKNENRWLKEEIRRLRHQLTMKDKEEWAHPNSCVHNSDPWETWKFK